MKRDNVIILIIIKVSPQNVFYYTTLRTMCYVQHCVMYYDLNDFFLHVCFVIAVSNFKFSLTNSSSLVLHFSA